MCRVSIRNNLPPSEASFAGSLTRRAKLQAISGSLHKLFAAETLLTASLDIIFPHKDDSKLSRDPSQSHCLPPHLPFCVPVLFKQQRGRKAQAGFTFKPQSVQKEHTVVHGHMLDSFCVMPLLLLPSLEPTLRRPTLRERAGGDSTSIHSVTNGTRWEWFGFQLGSWPNPLPTKGQPGRKLRDCI